MIPCAVFQKKPAETYGLVLFSHVTPPSCKGGQWEQQQQRSAQEQRATAWHAENFVYNRQSAAVPPSLPLAPCFAALRPSCRSCFGTKPESSAAALAAAAEQERAAGSKPAVRCGDPDM